MSVSPLPGRNAPFPGFEIVPGFTTEQAVLDVRGKIGAAAAPVLGAFFDSLIASGYSSAVLDLTELDAIEGTGLAVVVGAAHRLAGLGGRLTVRSTLPVARRIMEITESPTLLRLEPARTERPHLGPEPSAAAPGASVTAPPFDLVHELARISAVPADDGVVDGALRMVVTLAKATVGGADGVSISLRRHGHLETVVASDQTITDMDADQYATGEGPCVDASVEGHWFHAETLDHETRWPAFTPRAKKLGINAILSTPLLSMDRPVGALNIYSRSRAAFAPHDQELASVFATEASAILTTAAVGISKDQAAARISAALHMRQVIAQAQGVVMEREGLTEGEAYSVLRNFSQRSNRPLLERAEDVVASATQSRTGPRSQSLATPSL